MSNTIWVTGAHTPLGHGIASFVKAAGFSVVETGVDFDDTSFSAVKAFADLKGPFSCIVHCSMEFDPATAERNPGLVVCKDKVMALHFLRIAWEHQARFIAIGTPYVFSGTLASRDYTEKYRTAPICALGRLQREAELAILGADPHAIILRTGYVASVCGRSGAPRSEPQADRSSGRDRSHARVCLPGQGDSSPASTPLGTEAHAFHGALPASLARLPR